MVIATGTMRGWIRDITKTKVSRHGAWYAVASVEYMIDAYLKSAKIAQCDKATDTSAGSTSRLSSKAMLKGMDMVALGPHKTMHSEGMYKPKAKDRQLS